ncbi:MAG: ATP-dependent DNA helicase RecG, partial [Chloroflexales bacterium]|nr:ATP-dependent DNA helicase RecG [Chloroflexales bacterium]
AQSPEHKTQSADGGAETADDQPATKPKPRVPRPEPRPALSTQHSALSTPAKPLTLDSPIADVPGIGKANATSFKRLSLHTVRDLLYHFPHRYDDYSTQKRIADIQIGAEETITAEVLDVRTFAMRSGGGAVEVTVGDDSGTLKVVFFRQPWLAKQLFAGRWLVLSGKVAAYQGLRQMTGPTWEPFTNDELIHTGRLVPVHPLTKGLHERNARSIIKIVVDRTTPLVEDYLPETVRARANLLPLGEAIAQCHFPDSKEQLERARRRLGFDEFLFIQIGVMRRRLAWQGERGYALPFNQAVHEELLSKLPYQLTGAQVRALAQIFAAMSESVPMASLLQGDVGSGKTVVAAAALLQAVANGFQGAIMAPTQILAEQHYHSLKKMLSQVRVPRATTKPTGEQLSDAERAEEQRLEEIKRLLGMTEEDDLNGEGVRVALLTGTLGAKERRRVLEGIASGDVDIVVGTHALITEGVRYAQLGMVCVDEQHRFGVEQRNRLKDKGFNPHLLSMTATPIPRTLTMTIYGDLDAIVLDELPPGRQEIRTRWIGAADRDKSYRHLRREIAKGRQAFVICPLVEESEKSTLPSAVQMQERLQFEVFPDLRVGLIHGQLMPRDKDEMMLAFRAGEYDILVATAVVEVGIDVPNATTILIEGAERFGLSQLHQFRGRVGRGVHQSFCVLVSDQENEVTQQRLEAMEQHTDGFKLAEIDLELRGPGEFLGRRQSGTPDLKIAQFADTRLLHAARSEAQHILADDPQLAAPEHAALRAKVDQFWDEAAGAS